MMNNMGTIKAYLKAIPVVKTFYENVLYGKIINLFKERYKKNCLLSYSTLPFKQKKKYLLHPNFTENYVLAEILRKHGYNVDIYNNSYRGKINYSKYDLLVGEGLPLSNYYIQGNYGKKVIYYATGSHPLVQNYRSMKSVLRFAQNSGFYLPNSTRVVPESWVIAPSLADAVIILGNEITKNTFNEVNPQNKKFTLNPPFYATNVINSFNRKNRKEFLWFGSFGLVHKDLNTIIDVFINNPELTLHICGRIDEEKDFMDLYDKKIKKAMNIQIHGYVSINSDQFRDLMEKCAFVILSSCSEGCSTAIATALGNGGLIPIISKECGFTIKNGFYVETANFKDIEEKVQKASKLSDNKICEYSLENIEYVNEEFSIEKYTKNVAAIFSEILKDD